MLILEDNLVAIENSDGEAWGLVASNVQQLHRQGR